MDVQQLVSSCWFDDLLFHDWSNVSLRLRKRLPFLCFIVCHPKGDGGIVVKA